MSFVPRTLADGRVCCSAEHALCDTCKSHHASHRSNADGDEPDYTPPDGYAVALAKLRGELPPPPPPKPGDYTPPDGHAIAVAKMQKEGR